MLLNHILLACFWIVYCLMHSVLADLTIKEKVEKILRKSYKYYRLMYAIFAFVSLIAILLFAILMRSFLLYQGKTFLLIIGIIIGFPGFLIMIACIRKYLPDLSGFKNINKENFKNPLVVTGIHGYVRHPLYAGTFLFLWGLFIILPYLSFLISNIIITTYTLIGIQLEEKKLELEFGQQYRQYKQKVPRLIPFFKL